MPDTKTNDVCRVCARPGVQTVYDPSTLKPRRYCDECGDALRDYRNGATQ